MAVLKAKEVRKMTEKDREAKLKELKLELIRASVTANKTNAKTKEIKRAISRLLTYKLNKSSNEGELSKK